MFGLLARFPPGAVRCLLFDKSYVSLPPSKGILSTALRNNREKSKTRNVKREKPFSDLKPLVENKDHTDFS